jgi:chromosome partitioning protein
MAGRVISIANQKGGVGKTTTAISLAAVLADHQKRTLVCDLDPQAHATIGLGFQKQYITRAISEVLLDNVPAESVISETKIANLFLLPANANAIGIEIEMISRDDRETLLRKALEGIREKYDYILLDCPPSLGLLTINALAASDSVLIPTQCEFLAMEGLVQLLNTIRHVSESLGISLLIEGIVLTMFDARTKLSREVELEIRGYFEGRIRVFKTVIPRNIRLSEAPSHGLPITHYAKNTPGSWYYNALGEELMGID